MLTQRDGQEHEVAKSDVAPWFETKVGSSDSRRVLFIDGEEETEAEVVKINVSFW